MFWSGMTALSLAYFENVDLSIYLVLMVGFLFGLWLMTAANYCAQPDDPDAYEIWVEKYGELCEDYRVNDLWEGLIYVFEVFISTGDLSGVVQEPIAILFMVPFFREASHPFFLRR